MKHFKGPRGGMDAFGSAINSQAHRLNLAMKTTPQTILQVSQRSNIENFPRIRNHMTWLVQGELAAKYDDGWALTQIALDSWPDLGPRSGLRFTR